MWPRFQRGHLLLLDGKTQNGAAEANAADTATSRHWDRASRAGNTRKDVMSLETLDLAVKVAGTPRRTAS
jgi:hypothetical protein